MLIENERFDLGIFWLLLGFQTSNFPMIKPNKRKHGTKPGEWLAYVSSQVITNAFIPRSEDAISVPTAGGPRRPGSSGTMSLMSVFIYISLLPFAFFFQQIA
jgi:hypothetical protein